MSLTRSRGTLVVMLAACLPAALDAGEEPRPALPAATVGDVAISAEQIDAKMGGDPRLAGQLRQLEAREYELKRQVLDQLIGDLLLEKEAAARGTSVGELVAQEIEDKTPAVPEAEVKAHYERVKARIPPNVTEAEALERIAEDIRARAVANRRAALMTELRAKTAIRVHLEPPRVEVRDGDGPARGPEGAPVTIVEFSDFQCPYCSRVTPTLKRLEERYGDKVRLVFRDFPLSNHPQAPKAAEAAQCAHEQGKFWEMHDKLFAEQAKLQLPDLKQRAVDLGLDTKAFDACLESGKYEADWKRDLDEGMSYGVSGTPAFFINGRHVSGALPYDNFAQIIEDELERAGVPVPPPPPPQPAPAPAAAPAAPEPPSEAPES